MSLAIEPAVAIPAAVDRTADMQHLGAPRLVLADRSGHFHALTAGQFLPVSGSFPVQIPSIP